MHYGGSNVGNFPGMNAKAQKAQGRALSLEVTLPPLGVVVLKPGAKQRPANSSSPKL
jgi:1,4-alpha-glucan branching enzyme